MTDVMSSKARSALMSRIRGGDTKPELIVRKYLWYAGFRYGLHSARLPGRPDIVLPKWKAVVFVHGCFWHHHSECPCFRMPKTNTDFWKRKLARNQERDSAAVSTLTAGRWRVAIVWECAVRADAERVGRVLTSWLQQSRTGLELATKGGRVIATR